VEHPEKKLMAVKVAATMKRRIVMRVV
jgi:hypothetical protein